MITLKTLPRATRQEVFDQVARHLLTQKEKSVDLKGHCQYRSESGLSCAVGCLIAEDEYDESIENVSVRYLASYSIYHHYLSRHSELLQELQGIHDSCTVSEWGRYLRKLAETRGLDWSDELQELADKTK